MLRSAARCHRPRRTSAWASSSASSRPDESRHSRPFSCHSRHSGMPCGAGPAGPGSALTIPAAGRSLPLRVREPHPLTLKAQELGIGAGQSFGGGFGSGRRSGGSRGRRITLAAEALRLRRAGEGRGAQGCAGRGGRGGSRIGMSSLHFVRLRDCGQDSTQASQQGGEAGQDGAAADQEEAGLSSPVRYARRAGDRGDSRRGLRQEARQHIDARAHGRRRGVPRTR